MTYRNIKIKIDEKKSLTIHNIPVVFLRKSKWTYQCLTATGDVICSDKSIPKLEAKAKETIAKAYHNEPVKKPVAKKVTVKKGRLESKGQSLQNIKKPTDPKKKPRGSIKSLVFDMIIQSKEDDEIVNAVKSIFPESKFDQSYVSWYCLTMFKDKIIGPEHAP